jgi:hypothetical protein
MPWGDEDVHADESDEFYLDDGFENLLPDIL